ncbi:hypothetical protein [Candidatus Tisiphia endosymbiont of Beris chalybata]|uniref:hypothetical protein n=1 Tax=Candidatus Tisiphia endosymbiont of Beris chalybata TaxID=3066262 RepID=UPI00312CB48F
MSIISPSTLPSLGQPTKPRMSLEEEIAKKIKNFSDDIKRLKDKIIYLKNTWVYSAEEQLSKDIVKAFEDVVQPSIEQLDQYLRQQEEIKKEALLLETEFLELMIKMIQSIIKFQEILNKLYPGASKNIIDYIDHLLIALLATHMPIVALVVKVGRDVVFEPLINRIKSTISAESLTKIKESWLKKSADLSAQLTEIQQNESFRQKYQAAAQILILSEKTGYSPLQIAELRLDPQDLQKCDRKQLGALLEDKALIESSATSSNSKITQVIDTLREGINTILNNVLYDKDFNNAIEQGLTAAKTNLQQALVPTQSIYTRLTSSCKAVISILNVEKLIQNKVASLPEGKKIISEVGNLIKNNTQNILPKILYKSYQAKPYLETLMVITDNIRSIYKHTSPASSPASSPARGKS